MGRARHFAQAWVACSLVTAMFLGCGDSEGLDAPATCEGCDDSGAPVHEAGGSDAAPGVDGASSPSIDGSSDSAPPVDGGGDDDDEGVSMARLPSTVVTTQATTHDAGDDGGASDAASDASDPGPLPTLTIQPDSWQEERPARRCHFAPS